jgi:hypothetical protein
MRKDTNRQLFYGADTQKIVVGLCDNSRYCIRITAIIHAGLAKRRILMPPNKTTRN